MTTYKTINKNKMDTSVSKEVQISIRFINSNIVKLPLSILNNVLIRVVTNFIRETEENKEDIIDFKKEMSNLNMLKLSFYDLEDQAIKLNHIINCLKSDLKINEFAKPLRCIAGDKATYVQIQQLKPYKALGKCYKEPILFTISDSEEEKTTDMSTLKPKSGSKLKANVSVPNFNDNKVLSINDAGKTLNNRRCLSTSIAKWKPGPKSKKILVEVRDISNTENKKTVPNKIFDTRAITNKKIKFGGL